MVKCTKLSDDIMKYKDNGKLPNGKNYKFNGNIFVFIHSSRKYNKKIYI